MSIPASRVPVSGPLEYLAPGFVEELERKNYTPSSASAQLQMMARLSGWLAREGLDALLDRYQRYLTGERGICVAAAGGYLSKARRFLAWRAAAGGVGLEGLTAADVSAFVLAECPGRSTNWGRQLTLALRSFLVFGHVDGVLGESLASAVPRVAGWRLAGLPRALEPGVVQRLIVSCDRTTAIGRRDHAILLLLWRLALRRGDVAAMKLDVMDWSAGELVV